jgi:hypothetical protein
LTSSRLAPPSRRSPAAGIGGAALFAGTELLADDLVRASEPDPDRLQLKLSYSAVSDDNEEAVGGRLMQEDSRALSIELRRADGGWVSGRLPIENGMFVTNVIRPQVSRT